MKMLEMMLLKVGRNRIDDLSIIHERTNGVVVMMSGVVEDAKTGPLPHFCVSASVPASALLFQAGKSDADEDAAQRDRKVRQKFLPFITRRGGVDAG